jgi:hypothetical protein
MKTYWGSGGIGPKILNLSTKGTNDSLGDLKYVILEKRMLV